MKQRSFWFFAVITALFFTGCVFVYQKLILGKWQVDTYYRNGEEQTEQFYFLYGDYEITFHPDGEFTEKYRVLNTIPLTNVGTWEIIYNSQQWQLKLTDDSSERVYEIIKLTPAELQIKRDLGGGENEKFILEKPTPET